MPTLPSWSNSGPNRYDYAINGVPFFSQASKEYPYQRETIDNARQQIDTTKEPGEQSLQGWWYRSQSSFDLGAGIKFMDPVRDELLNRRFSDSNGVFVFEAGQVTLVRKTSKVSAGSDSGRHYAVGVANGGQEGALVSSGSTLTKYVSGGTTSTVSWGGSGTIADLCSDGGAYYAATTSGVYRGLLPGSSGTKIYSFPSGTSRIKVGYAKQRLFLAADEYLWDAPATPDATPTALVETPKGEVTTAGNRGYLYKHPSSGWTWSAVADAPAAVYLAGYAGDASVIYATSLKGGTETYPDVVTPYVVAEMPRGERVLSLLSYMGTYLVIGTNAGVRIAVIDGNSNLMVGPLTIRSDADVVALYARGDYVWAGGANCDGATGLYILDLSKTSETNSFRFPYARNIYLDGNTWAGKTVDAIVPIGYTGRLAFTIADVGLAVEAASEKVASGWLETGRIRFDTAEDKIFQYVRVSNLSAAGQIKVSWRNEAGVLADLYTYNTANIRTLDTDGSDQAPRPWASYRFTLIRNSTDTASSPVLLSYQSKARPSHVRQRLIQVTLQCLMRERGVTGKVVERSVWDRIKAIETAEETGAVVRFQDLGTGEDRLVLIEQVRFLSNFVPESRQAQADPGGVLVVTMRTVSPTG